MKLCLVYDCLYPWTIGGAERWMRGLAEALAAEGHEITFLTRLQWSPDEPPEIPGVRVIAVSREEPLYGPDGNRTIGEPLRFGWGVYRHLRRHGREYDVVHTASFPYFSLLAAAQAQRRGGYRLVVDWFEVWSDAYWAQYLGGLRGRVARAIQRRCARVQQEAFCFAAVTAARLRALGLRSEATVLRGLSDEVAHEPVPPEALAVYAGRMIREKQAPAVVGGIRAARATVPELRGVIFGDGPQLPDVRAAIGDDTAIVAPGFVAGDEVESTLARACCMVLPSVREGYGMIVVEAAARGVPSVLVAGADNAAVELIEQGVNGFVVADASPAALGAAIIRCWEQREALRAATASWFRANAQELSMRSSLERVLESYRTSGVQLER